MKKIENQITVINKAFDSLAINKNIQNRILCFIGLPTYYFWNSVAQAVWLKGVNLSLPIYYDDSTWVIDDVWGEFLRIEPIKNGYRFVSLNNAKMWFQIFPHPHRMTLIMGKKKFNEYDENLGRLYNFELIFDQKYLDQNPVFISWNYKNQKFLILDPPLK
ncbi:MAG: hypothetical protein JXA94_02150 [Parachlamydiales bacterium]|nr:hypothetical protein [Parachlamydiales bacterium]